MNILCWLWPLLAGIICGVLGYLLGRLMADKWKTKYEKLQEELNTCNKAKEDLKSELKDKLNELEESSSKTNSLEANLKAVTDTKTMLEKDLEVCRKRNSKLEAGLKSGGVALAGASSFLFDSSVAEKAFGKKVKLDDLKIIEGIGEKIEQLFNKNGIKTWKDLSEASVKRCQEILDTQEERYRVHKPDTWPKQAELAYQGKWKELAKWQDELEGGRES